MNGMTLKELNTKAYGKFPLNESKIPPNIGPIICAKLSIPVVIPIILPWFRLSAERLMKPVIIPCDVDPAKLRNNRRITNSHAWVTKARNTYVIM